MIAMMSNHHDLREKIIMLSLYINHYHHVCPEGAFFEGHRIACRV
jgi:hypothetical protein